MGGPAAGQGRAAVRRRVPPAGGKGGVGVQQRLVKAVEAALFPFHEPPVHPAGPLQGPQLLQGEAGHPGLHLFHRLLLGVDVFGRQAAQYLPLDQQSRPLGLHPGGGGVGAGAVLAGGPVLGQPGVDPPDGLLVIPRRLEPGHIVGQAGVQAAEPFILIGRHRHSPFSSSAVTASQKLTASYNQPAASVPVPVPLPWGALS